MRQQRWWLLAAIGLLAFIVGFFLQNPALVLPDELTRFPEEKWNFARPVASWLDHSYITDGFGRRLLVGTLLYPVPPDARLAVYTVMSALAVCGFAWILFILVRESKIDAQLAQTVLYVAAISAAGAMNLGWLFGFFENFLHLIFVVCVMWALRGWTLPVALLSALGLLIHTSYLFYALPLVVSLMVSNGARGLPLLASSVMVIALAALLYAFGNTEIDAMGADRGLLQPSDFDLLTHGVTIAYLALISVMHWHIFKRLGLPRNSLFFAPYFGLTLFALGVDYMRWVTMIFVAVIISIFSAARLHAISETPKLNGFDRVIMMCVAFPLLGPIGNTRPFEALRQAVSLLF